MAKIVKSEFWHIMLFQNSRNMRCKITRLDKLSNFVYIDVVQIFFTVAASAELSVSLLFSSHLKEDLFEGFN